MIYEWDLLLGEVINIRDTQKKSLMLWGNLGGAEVDRSPFSHPDAYLVGAANTSKGAPNFRLSHLGVILETITMSLDVTWVPVATTWLSAKHWDLPGHELGWLT